MKRQKIFIAIEIILGCFLIYNIVWFVNWRSYGKYKNSVGYEDSTNRYFCNDSEGYRYAVFAPEYLRFVGNLTVGNNVWSDKIEESTCSLIIWPLFMGGYEFGVNIYVPIKADENFVYRSYSFLLDENGDNISGKLSKEEKTVLEENKDLIRNTYQKAYKMWGIGANAVVQE